ncbi:MAG: Unknown protein [uncultured Sulfurovum sp.]|uniref:Uncharacterized protein n=1 Tax=uncultured Sulfurovum sp. TaxID=269237 RepID=A0A6S6TZC6_9BACT|nr:MAG: Unknown protein [uncultured Sulfurovum sp.]
MRLTLNKPEFILLQKLIDESQKQHQKSLKFFDDEEMAMLQAISLRISQNALKPISPKKKNATKEATQKRIKEAKNKISNAVNMMRFENKKITISSIASEAGVSYNTVKKYKDSINEIAKTY